MPPLITLTTDFGTRDAYVAQLKGVLYSEGPPGLTVVDLSHELAPFDVHAAALFVAAALPRFPPGAVHLCVVDPGVGSARRALIVERDEMQLVGPDNGLFSYLYDGSERAYAIEATRTTSSTFHGRDLFAPVAAQLAAGASPATLGQRIDRLERLTPPPIELRDDTLRGCVILVDRYGNLITNITREALRSFAGAVQIAIADRVVAGLVDHYAQGRGLLALIGSSGRLELAVREGSAAELLGVKAGQPVWVTRSI